jgi:hypothetical protein
MPIIGRNYGGPSPALALALALALARSWRRQLALRAESWS